MRDHEHRAAAAAQALDRRGHELGALAVEVGGRLVEHDERRVAQERAREREPAALAGGERAARRRRRPSRSRRAARRRSRRRRRARPRPRAPVRPTPPGSPSRMLSATVPRKRVGRCGTHATCRAPRVACGSRRGRRRRRSRGPPSARRGPAGAPRPCSCRRRSRRPARPSRPGRARARSRRAPAPGRDGIGERDAPRAARRASRGSAACSAPPGADLGRRVEQLEHPLGDREPVRAGVELRAELPQRQVELGREHEHGQRGLEGRAPPPTSRTPTVTATSATPSVAASSSTEPGEEADAQRAHRGAPVLARRPPRSSSACCAAAVERAQRRQPAHDVEEVRREQAQRLPALARPLLGVAPDEPHEHGHEREREQHDQRRRARSIRGDPERARRRGTTHGQHELRQVAGEVGLERVDALRPRRPRPRRSACRRAPPAAPGGAARRARAAAPRARRTRRGARRPRSRPGQQRPRPAKASASSDELGGDLGRAGAVERLGRRSRASSVACSEHEQRRRRRRAPRRPPAGCATGRARRSRRGSSARSGSAGAGRPSAARRLSVAGVVAGSSAEDVSSVQPW